MAVGTLYSVAKRSSAFTSTSCGCADIGSQKNMSTSISLLAIFAPSCWSPPKGPDLSIVISNREFEASLQRRSISVSATMRPVVPVHIRRCDNSFSQFHATHSARSCFMASCATSAIVNLFSIVSFSKSFLLITMQK